MAELKDSTTSPPPYCSVGLKDDCNIFEWRATVSGPPHTPYDTCLFNIHLDLTNFPDKAPVVKVLNESYHMNISTEGRVCIDILSNSSLWNPNFRINHILEQFIMLLHEPNPNDPYRGDLAKLFKEDKDSYSKKATEVSKRATQAFLDG